MKNSKLKIAICLVWLIGIAGFVFFQRFSIVHGKNNESKLSIPKPDLKEVEKFNALMLERFLKMPGFGYGRIIPEPPPSIHLSTYNQKDGQVYFSPKEGDEKNIIDQFEQQGWKIGLFLFGKTAHAYKGKSDEQISISYRSFKPIAVTKNIKENELKNSEVLLTQAKKAFYEFQFNKKSDEKKLEFSSDGWEFLAKPVRALNESCVSCHKNNVVVKDIGFGNYEIRPRKVGDVNGILVYAFQKVKK